MTKKDTSSYPTAPPTAAQSEDQSLREKARCDTASAEIIPTSTRGNGKQENPMVTGSKNTVMAVNTKDTSKMEPSIATTPIKQSNKNRQNFDKKADWHNKASTVHPQEKSTRENF